MNSDGNYGITTVNGIALTAGQHVIRVSFDQISTSWGIVGEFDWFRFNAVDTTAPALLNPDQPVSYDEDSRTALLKFNEPIQPTLTAADVEVIDASSGAVVSVPVSVYSDYFGNPAWVGVRMNASPADGHYRVRLRTGSVRDAAGNANASPLVSGSYVFLAGDANHDAKVDIADLGILATNWQQSPRTFSKGDFNFDGSVDIADLGILATNWQKNIGAASRAGAMTGPAVKPFTGTSTSTSELERMLEAVLVSEA
jgi:hypothetical protein